MSHKIKFLDNASKDALKLKKEEPKSFTKLMKMVDELKEHPMTGTGKPEYLKYDKRRVWSRRITQKHRLVYKIYNDVLWKQFRPMDIMTRNRLQTLAK